MEKQTTPVSAVEQTWPGAFALYKHSKEAVKVNLWSVIFMALTGAIATIIVDVILPDDTGFALLRQLLGIVIGSLTTVGTTLLYLAGIRGQRLEFEDAFQKSYPYILRMVGLSIVTGLMIMGSLLLLIIPFFFVMPRLILASYYLVDKNLGVMDSVRASWAGTKGHVGKVWGIIGVNILMALLMITIIGFPVSVYLLIMYSAAYALLYGYCAKQNKE